MKVNEGNQNPMSDANLKMFPSDSCGCPRVTTIALIGGCLGSGIDEDRGQTR